MCTAVELQNLKHFSPFWGGGKMNSAKQCKMILLMEKVPLKQLLFLVSANPVNGITWVVINQKS